MSTRTKEAKELPESYILLTQVKMPVDVDRYLEEASGGDFRRKDAHIEKALKRYLEFMKSEKIRGAELTPGAIRLRNREWDELRRVSDKVHSILIWRNSFKRLPPETDACVNIVIRSLVSLLADFDADVSEIQEEADLPDVFRREFGRLYGN